MTLVRIIQHTPRGAGRQEEDGLILHPSEEEVERPSSPLPHGPMAHTKTEDKDTSPRPLGQREAPPRTKSAPFSPPLHAPFITACMRLLAAARRFAGLAGLGLDVEDDEEGHGHEGAQEHGQVGRERHLLAIRPTPKRDDGRCGANG